MLMIMSENLFEVVYPFELIYKRTVGNIMLVKNRIQTWDHYML